MSTQFFKRSLSARLTAFIIIANLILFSAPAASVFAADALRPRAADSTLTAADIANELIEKLVVTFSDVRQDDVPVAGGKGANLGELGHVQGISVPPGIIATTKAFRLHIDNGMVEIENGQKITLREYIERRLKKLESVKGGYENSKALAEAGQDIRMAVQLAEMPLEVKNEITRMYEGMGGGKVAVRSSATAEDLAEASFAGQQDTYLNMEGIEQVLDAVKRDWASLFTDRAIYYRNEQKIDHGTAYLSAVIQRMVESKMAGTGFSVDMASGFDVIKIDAAWGLGEGVVSGTVTPDSWIVYRDKSGRMRVLRRDFGAKLQKVVYRTEEAVVGKEGTEVVDTSYEERHKFCLTDAQVLEVAEAILNIYRHYGKYMDVEWCFDGSGKLWVVQARSETVWNQWKKEHPRTVKIENTVVPEEIADKAKKLLRGVIGSKSAAGRKIYVDSTKRGVELARELDRVKKGDILVTEMTKPDMVPAMKRAGAIVTDQGGPTCHAAIVARELGIPCIVGTGNATKMLKDNATYTVDANRGAVYDGKLKIDTIVKNIEIPKLRKTITKIKKIIASPSLAMSVADLSDFESDGGIGLARKEVIDATDIRVHPLAGLAYDKDHDFMNKAQEQAEKGSVDNVELKAQIEEIMNGYDSYRAFFLEKLANDIALIAATQKGNQRVYLRTTDFKTNEYREQVGGILFEPEEKNPMMGYRGIYRMLSPDYKEAFELELEAIKLAREKQANIDVMLPVVRTVEEMEEAVELMANKGLFGGKDPCHIIIMAEVAADVILADELFSKLAELAKKYNTKAGMSIGSNDLTQFTLALGRDNEKMKPFYDEANPAVKRAIEILVKTAKKYGVETGICGQRPSNDPAFAGFLVQCGIDSVSVVPEVYDDVNNVVAAEEERLAGQAFNPNIAGWQMPSTLVMGNPKTITASEVKASEIIEGLEIHPLRLSRYDKVFGLYYRGYMNFMKKLGFKKEFTTANLSGMTAEAYVVSKAYQALMDKARSTPADLPIIYSTDDLDKTAYERLFGGDKIEEFDENPQLGFCGLARVVNPEYQKLLRWQLKAIKKAMKDSGRANIGIKLNLARTIQEVEDAMKIIRASGLNPGENGFMVGMEIAVTSNALLINEFINTGINFLVENKDRYLSYTFAEDPDSKFIQIGSQRKERGWDNSRKVWTNAAEKNGIPMVQLEGETATTAPAITPAPEVTTAPVIMPRTAPVGLTLTQADLSPAEGIVYMETSAGLNNFVYTVKHSRMGHGRSRTVVIGANAIMENAGAMTTLAMLKETADMVVYAQDEATLNKLKAAGVEEVVDHIVLRGTGEAGVASLDDLAVAYAKEGPTALITAPQDRAGLNLKWLRDYDIVLVNLMAPRTEEGRINSMPMAVTRAVAGLLRADKKIADEFELFSRKYVSDRRISQADLENMNKLDFLTCDMPMLQFSEKEREVLDAQLTYQATMGSI